jgi:hypothetical protein
MTRVGQNKSAVKKLETPCPAPGDAMEIPGSGYLYALVTITFAGIAGMIVFCGEHCKME